MENKLQYRHLVSTLFGEKLKKLMSVESMSVDDKLELYHLYKSIGLAGDDYNNVIKDLNQEEKIELLNKDVGVEIKPYSLNKALEYLTTEDASILSPILKEE